jgi:Raf kinase inhibitor-like YbhB/YbcL family protein
MPKFRSAMAGLVVIALSAAAWGATLKITSPAFQDGGALPSKYTCDTAVPVNPPLQFSGVPANTKSMVLIVEDIDAPKPFAPDGIANQWLVLDISADDKGIKEGAQSETPGYIPPCPYEGTQRYYFRLYALDIQLTGVPMGNPLQVKEAIKGHIIDQAELMATYTRTKKP